MSRRVLVVHGAGGSGAGHAAFVEAARARGWDAEAPDLPGHGTRRDEPLAELRLDVPPGAALRGSSLGAFLCLLAAAGGPPVAAVVALAPTTERLILERHAGWDANVDAARLEARLRETDVLAAAARIACPVLYVHAADDERIPLAAVQGLHEATPRGELVVLPHGGHGGPSHDPAVHALTLDWLADAVGP